MPFKKGGGHHRGRKSEGRKSTRISLNVTRTPTPRVDPDDEDEEMADGDNDIQYEVDEDEAEAPQDEPEEEEAATPAADDDEDDEDVTPRITSMPRRRGRGGRARGRSGYANTPEPGEDGSESGTPMRRRRGRPPGTGAGRGRGGARGRRRGGAQPDAPRVVIDKQGNALDVVDDEIQVDFDDEEGQEKVDTDGNLQGGREYRVRTFKVLGKGDRLYMLSTEPARCTGFRDSYLFFTKHPKLFKVLLDEEAKMDLISRDILPNSYKGRNIGVVTARSVFREFGAKIIVGGKRIIDDYKVSEARENGWVEGELADPDDHVPENRAEYNRNRYVAWFGASEVYRSQAGGATVPGGKQGAVGKRRNNITVQNWQSMHAREASRFNSNLTALRHANANGVYDNNTNMMFYPKIMQPTHAKWEYVPPESTPSDRKQLTNGLSNGYHTTNGAAENDETAAEESTIFAKVPPIISRNFIVVDTTYTAPPISNAGFPGPDGHVEDPTAGPNGLSTVSQDLIDELPADCRASFEAARETELRWKRQWGTEASSGQRGVLKIGFNGYPV